MNLSVEFLIIAIVIGKCFGNILTEIERINKVQSYWQAGRNENLKKGNKYLKGLLGTKISSEQILQIKNYETLTRHNLPDTFDARQEWSNCHSISVIDNQGKCGCCWGCQPYEIKPSSQKDVSNLKNSLECHKMCTNKKYQIPYKQDKQYGINAYSLHPNVNAIQYEVFARGPVEAIFYVYKDFFYYKTGVYVRTSNKYVGIHAVRVLGWGTDNGTDYWLAANSWGKHWGNEGTFKIRRGTDECKFESYITAGSV